MNRSQFRKSLSYFSKMSKRIFTEQFMLNLEDKIFQRLSSSCKQRPNLVIEDKIADILGLDTNVEQPTGFKERLLFTEAFFKNKPYRPNRRIQSAVDFHVFKIFGIPECSVKPAPVEQSASRLPGNTASGYPEFHTPKREVLQNAINAYYKLVALPVSQIIPAMANACLSYCSWRTQERDSGTKYRIYIIVAQVQHVIESRFAFPFFDEVEKQARNINLCYSWYTDYLELRSIWIKAQSYKYIHTLDHTAFDQNTGHKEIIDNSLFFKRFFKIKNKIDSTLFDGLVFLWSNGILVFGATFVERNVIKITNSIEKKLNILPSGIVPTNVLGTIINVREILYILLSLNIDIRGIWIRAKGDDLIVCSNVYINWVRVRKEYFRVYGREFEPDAIKTFKHGEPIFHLGYWFDNVSKHAVSESLLLRQTTRSSRFISTDVIERNTIALSRVVSVLSNVSNGYEIYQKYFEKGIAEIFGGEGNVPQYYHDLVEYPSYDPSRLKPVIFSLKYGWGLSIMRNEVD